MIILVSELRQEALMRPERVVIGLILLAAAAALAWGAVRLLRGPKTSAGQGAAALGAMVGAIFLAWWAVNLFSA